MPRPLGSWAPGGHPRLQCSFILAGEQRGGKGSAQPSGGLSGWPSGSRQETDGPPTCECRATDGSARQAGDISSGRCRTQPQPPLGLQGQTGTGGRGQHSGAGSSEKGHRHPWYPDWERTSGWPHPHSQLPCGRVERASAGMEIPALWVQLGVLPLRAAVNSTANQVCRWPLPRGVWGSSPHQQLQKPEVARPHSSSDFIFLSG